MNYASKVTEDDAIGSVEGCWEVVKKAEGGMGMMLYNAYTYPAEVENIGNIGLRYGVYDHGRVYDVEG